MAGKIIVSDEEIRNIEYEIKSIVAGVGSNISDLVRRMNEKYNTADTPQAVTRQLKNGTMPYWKIHRIAAILGYKITWDKPE